MSTVRNVDHFNNEVEFYYHDDDYYYDTEYEYASSTLDLDYDDIFDLHASTLTGWAGSAEAAWKLDSVYQIKSVILKTIKDHSFLFKVEVVNSATSASTTCSKISESVDLRQLGYDCNALGDSIKISETSG